MLFFFFLQLQDKVQLKKKIVEVRTIPKSGKDLLAGTKCVVSGWGTTQVEAPKYSATLQEVEVMVIDRELCNCYYNSNPNITDDMLCAGNKQGNKDACWVSHCVILQLVVHLPKSTNKLVTFG